MAPSEEEIYQEHVLDHYEDPYHRGACNDATHRHEDDNPLCGDVVRIELRVRDGLVEQAWFDGDGCCISQASASMLMENVEGKSVDHIKELDVQEMLAVFEPSATSWSQRINNQWSVFVPTALPDLLGGDASLALCLRDTAGIKDTSGYGTVTSHYGMHSKH